MGVVEAVDERLLPPPPRLRPVEPLPPIRGRVLCLDNEIDRKVVVETLATGEKAVVIHTMGTYGLWVNANNRFAVDWIYKTKNRPQDEALVTILTFPRLIETVDLTRVHPEFKHLFISPDALDHHFRLPHHLIVPIKTDVVLPNVLVTADPNGKSIANFGTTYPPLTKLIKEFYSMCPNGVLGGTSFNISGHASDNPTIYEDAVAYASRHAITGGKHETDLRIMSDPWFEDAHLLHGSHLMVDARTAEVRRAGSVHVQSLTICTGIELTVDGSAGVASLGLLISADQAQKLLQVPPEKTMYELARFSDIEASS